MKTEELVGNSKNTGDFRVVQPSFRSNALRPLFLILLGEFLRENPAKSSFFQPLLPSPSLSFIGQERWEGSIIGA